MKFFFNLSLILFMDGQTKQKQVKLFKNTRLRQYLLSPLLNSHFFNKTVKVYMYS